jgi:hypothetical protein
MALFGRESPEDQRRADAWGLWLRRRHPLAIASLVLGIFSLIEFGVLLVFGIAGIALGVMALRQLKAQDPEGPDRGHRMAWAGIVTSVVSLVIAAWLYAYGPRGPR